MQSPAINQAMDILKLLRQVTESPDEVPVKLSKSSVLLPSRLHLTRLPFILPSMTIIWSFLPHTA